MPVDRSGSATIQGLADFQRELKAADLKLPRMMGVASKEAADIVASDARGRADMVSRLAAKAGASVKAVASQLAAKVTLGGPNFPFAMGAEFGAKKFAQFEVWRGNRHREGIEPGSGVGYFLYPAIRSKSDEAVNRYALGLDRIMRQVFPD